MAEKPRILLLGATGYIGGSILTTLLQISKTSPVDPSSFAISALVRKPYQASILADAGVKPIIFKDLDDFEVIKEAASNHDIVIAAASARHAECARACLEGLGERRMRTGNDMHYVHISGTSTLGDWPVSGDRIDTKIYSDIKDDIFELEKNWPESHSPVRKVNQVVIELGGKEAVDTYLVTPPLIFGPGTGFFTLGFGQIHMMTQLALKQKKAVVLGDGSGIWSRVHILDLAHLFSLLVQAILDKKQGLPTGRRGYYFAENGYQSWKSLSEEVGRVGKSIGVFESEEVEKVELQVVADMFYHGNLRDAEGVLGSNSRTKADRARDVLGWRPEYGGDAFLEEVREVVSAMAKEET